jgi:hypothetical protein
MAEYRIVATLDPSGVSSGTAKVKQELRGVDTVADSTKRHLQGSFQAPELVAALGNLTTRLTTIEGSLDRVAAASTRTSAAQAKVGTSAQGAAAGQGTMEAATRRVLQAVDKEAVELIRLNALLEEASVLHQRGAITGEQFSRVQNLLSKSGREQAAVTGSQRMGMQQLGFQLGDVATMYSLGAKPAQIFGSQIGQVSQALMLMGGDKGSMLGKAAGFLSGPWGIALTVGTILLTPLISKILETNDALGDSVKQMKEDAKQADITRQAKEKFAHSEEGVAKAIRDATQARKDSIASMLTEAERVNIAAKNNLNEEISIRNKTKAAIDYQRALLAAQLQRATGPGGEKSDLAAMGLGRVQAELDALETRLGQEDTRIAEANAEYLASRADLAAEAAKRAVDPIAQVNRQYDAEVEAAKRAAVATGQVTVALTRQITAIEERRKAALKEAGERDNKPPSDGVSRFKSQQQAIGIAGRELQGSGLDISGNSQFRKTSGHANDADHNRTAIDVNVSANPGRSTGGVTEAAVPDIKERFDELARLYQARGYDVIWNKQFYPAGGNGPSKAAKGHQDHLHIKAPTTIVGKDTGSSTAQQVLSEAQRAITEAEQQRDFVAQVVDSAASRGIKTSTGNVQAQIDKVANDFQRRFNRAMTDAERTAVKDALTAAEARETAAHFESAYIAPLQRLRELQGKTGVEREILNAQLTEAARLGRTLSEAEAKSIRDLYEGQSGEDFDNAFVKPLQRMLALQGRTGLDREILNKQLDESLRLGRELTPVEAERIASTVRQTDALTREGEVLGNVLQPLQDYHDRIAALNALLAAGSINQTQYNARIAELGQAARQSIAGMPGNDPNGVTFKTGQTFKSYEDIAAAADEQARYDQELASFENNRAQLLQLGLDYNALQEAAHRRHIQNMNAIDRARTSVALQSAQSISDSLLSIAENSAGRQSAVYRGLFAVSKGFAIAQATIALYQNVAEAMKYGFPQNLPFIAAATAQGATIIASLSAIRENFAEGGYVSGAGGAKDDRIPINASNGEFMVNADATARHRPLLEAVNAGTLNAHLRRARNDNAGILMGGGPRVTINNLAPGVEFDVQPGLTMDEVVITARKVAREEAPRAVAADIRNPNGRVSKAMKASTGVGQKRS